jgi:hypothetical protein
MADEQRSFGALLDFGWRGLKHNSTVVGVTASLRGGRGGPKHVIVIKPM